MSAANPYWLIWWLTIGLGYVMFSMKYGWLGVALFFVGHILADFAWYTLVSGAVAQGRRLISDRIYQGFLAGCGVFLFGFGRLLRGPGSEISAQFLTCRGGPTCPPCLQGARLGAPLQGAANK